MLEFSLLEVYMLFPPPCSMSGVNLPLNLIASHLAAGQPGAPLAAADARSPGPAGEAQSGWEHAGALNV